MKKLIAVALLISLCGCTLIPERWDENQAGALTTVRQEAGDFDCKGDVPAQLAEIKKNIEWIKLYSDYRKAVDISKMMVTLDNTVIEFQTRLASGPVSPTYCQLKKTIIVEQADVIGSTIKGSIQ